MKKSLLALAVAAALPAAAQAQTSSIVLYGIADAAIEYSNDQVNTSLSATQALTGPGKAGMRLQSGTWMSSRLGMRGNEPLGKTGMSAIFNIEHRFQIDTGDTQGGQIYLLPGATNATPNNKFWNGTAWVGLATGFGEVTVGRQYTPIFWAFYFPDWTLNAGYNNWAGVNGNPGNFNQGLQAITYGAVRADNSVAWKSPAFGGLTVYAMYSFGESLTNSYASGTTNVIAGEQVTGSQDLWGVSGVWRLGNLMVTGGYHKHSISLANTCTQAAGNGTTSNLVAQPVGCVNTTIAPDQSYVGSVGYNFGSFGVSLGYAKNEFNARNGGNGTASTLSWNPDVTTYLLSAYARVGPGRLYANVQNLKLSGFGYTGPTTANSIRNGDGIQAGVTYMWELTNRTGLYAGVGYNDASPFQSATLASGVKTLDSLLRYSVGVNHKF